ncbi:peptide chain release factor N(5)-glutamine methyltransferase [Lentibacter sp. XHP0401]|uniref:peptide chain release factor N(5)-glutamine methyltransferase n=1 Tax=Lentibacter sp. XHP0401 TaxID=2984334 RepID=UPI0021E8365B|nr:peptide chain release factor N(5)-glutamine methyltransferase [Lentibacter sp. XHP0401]MCV2891717.1 peptide chain release factor N(5)-glutamine methyltransferase [Lentibacter sp. XHP0401]
MSHATVGEVLRAGVKTLSDSKIESAARDARLLMAHMLDVDPSRMTLLLQDDLSDEKKASFQVLIAERSKRRPVAQIIGRRQFYGRVFEVSGDVLDPRGDTETLVEAALSEAFDSVLDLGTGSGCIVLSLLAERAGAQGVGADMSAAALSVAGRNAEAFGVAGRVAFVLSDWFESLEGRFDLIVSNPPYIAADEMSDLQPELAYEPRMALTDEADGLSAYRVICCDAGDYLKPNGRLMFEIGAGQAADVSEMMRAVGFGELQVLSDLEGRDRVVWGRKTA